MDLTCGAEIVNPFTPGFSAIRVARSLVFCVMFCRSLFLFLVFFFSSLYCLSFFDLQLLITPLISSNFSYAIVHFCDGVFLNGCESVQVFNFFVYICITVEELIIKEEDFF
jgi:hypothetical protein